MIIVQSKEYWIKVQITLNFFFPFYFSELEVYVETLLDCGI
jgi:hypothetical protein